MNTLRNAISILEDDGNIEHKLQVIKKSMCGMPTPVRESGILLN